MTEYLLKIKFDLESKQFEANSSSVRAATGNMKVGFDGLIAKAAAASLAFNQITVAATTVAASVKAIMSPFMEAQTDMAKIASLGVKNTHELNQAVQNLAANGSFNLHDLRDGLYQIVSAGVDASNQISVLDASARAAKAGIAQTSDALNLGSTVIKGYGIEWSNFEAIMDKAFMTVNIGQTEFPDLARNMGQVIPLASALKVNVNELFGAFATLTGVTGNTNEVATQLRAVMDGLASPTQQLTNLMKQHGYATVEDAVRTEGLSGIFKILGEATGGSASKMNEFFGRVEATNAALALSTTLYPQLIEATKKVTDSVGEMNEAYKIQNDTLESQNTILRNRWQIFKEQLGQKFEPIANEFLKVLTGEVKLDWSGGVIVGIHQNADAVIGLNKHIDENAKKWDGAAKAANNFNNVAIGNKPISVTPSGQPAISVSAPRAKGPVVVPYSFQQTGGIETSSVDEDLQAQMSINESMLGAKAQSDDDYYKNKIALAEDAYNTMAELYGKESAEAWAAAADKKAAEQDYIDFKTAIDMAAINAIGQLVDAAFGQTKAGAAAAAMINTYEAVTKALTGSAPPWNFIAAAAVMVQGMQQVSKISSTKLEKREFGGDVWANMPYLVGERGPEIFAPRQSGTIIPNSAIGAAGVDTAALRDAIASGFEKVKIEFRGEMVDYMKFYRDTFPSYQQDEARRTRI